MLHCLMFQNLCFLQGKKTLIKMLIGKIKAQNLLTVFVNNFKINGKFLSLHSKKLYS